VAQTIPKVDQAFEDKFTGASVTVNLGAGPTVLPVEFFQEQPDVEEALTRKFPSISIALRSIERDEDRRQGEQEGERYKVGENTSGPVYTSSMVPVPTPYRLIYFLETWVLARAVVDRAVQQLVLERLGDKGVLTLDSSAPDGADEDVHAFMTGFDNNDEDVQDQRIYHKTYTYEVLVELGPNDVLTVQQAMELRLSFKKGKNDPATPVADQPDLVLDTTLIVTG
jgi:hypothetical protein